MGPEVLGYAESVEEQVRESTGYGLTRHPDYRPAARPPAEESSSNEDLGDSYIINYTYTDWPRCPAHLACRVTPMSRP